MSLKIMAVDDEPQVLNLLKGIIEPLGCEVQTLTESREAVRRLENEKFDGVFVDVRMPHPDGFELTQMVRSSPLNRDIPVVMLTGYDDVETMRKGFQAGATFFLGKPFTRERVEGLFKATRGIMLREKRRHARLPYRTPVDCRWGTKHFKSTSLNIGEGGMLLEPSGGLEVDQQVELEFAMPQLAGPCKVRAQVVYKEPPDRMGVEFLSMEPEDREALQSYILGGVKV